MKYSDVFLGLGSNLGQRREHLRVAIQMLQENKNVTVVQESKVIETEPIGGIAKGLFLNQVIEIETDFEPLELLQHCLCIEQSQGRVRGQKWDSRTLDIDILFFGALVIAEGDLRIPHPELEKRSFVLVPMKELAPEFTHPVSKKSIEHLSILLST